MHPVHGGVLPSVSIWTAPMPQEHRLESGEYVFPETKQEAEATACTALYPFGKFFRRWRNLSGSLGREAQSRWFASSEGMCPSLSTILNRDGCHPTPYGNSRWLLMPLVESTVGYWPERQWIPCSFLMASLTSRGLQPEVYFWGLHGGSQCTCVVEVHTAPGEERHLECQPGTEGFLLARSR